jgi:glycerol-3-phosphate cytidylyltransferase
MFHIGHLNLLRRARADCDRLVVGVVADECIVERKRRVPVICEADRLEIIRAIRHVDEAWLARTYYAGIEDWNLWHFDKWYNGSDWTGGHPNRKALEDAGVQVVIFPYTEHVSTTKLREKVSGNR